MIRRHRRGYTMIELAIGLSLTMVLLLLAVGWVGTLMRTSAASVEQRASSRDAAFVKVRFADDFANARPCSHDGSGWAFNSISGEQVSFYADVVDPAGAPFRDGFADLVVWDFFDAPGQDGTLRRGVLAGSGACNLSVGAVDLFDVVAGAEPLGGAPTFLTFAPGGAQMTVADCSVDGADCDVTSVRLQTLVKRASPGDAPTELYTTATAARVGRWN